MKYDDSNLDHTCATVEAHWLAMRALAAHRGWGHYDVDEDPEEIFDETGAVIEALVVAGWLDFADYVWKQPLVIDESVS